MIRIGVLGYAGRMGTLIAQDILTRDDCSFAGGAVRSMPTKPLDVFVTTDALDIFKRSDVVIDFTNAEATLANVKLAVEVRKPLVCGTTGISFEAQQALKNAATQIPVLYASNTSLSLGAMKRAVAITAKLLGNFDYDVSILDEHHRMKKDAPSGTAKTLGEAVVAANSGAKQPTYAAIRSGNIVGEHEVTFAGGG